MTLILRKSGKVGERTRWNLSFSGVSLSHKRGWITLNSRGRSTIDLPGPLFTFRVGKTGTVLWFLFFVITDIIAFLGKILLLPFALLIDGAHELWWEEVSERDLKIGWSMLIGGIAGFAIELYALFRWILPLFS